MSGSHLHAPERAEVGDVPPAIERPRCFWATREPNLGYHDTEWGVPLHDDRRLFEFLLLEGAQAGLSWETILKKRDAYRRAFDDFDAEKIVRYDDERIAALMADAGIVRNRLKITSAIDNARAFLEARQKHGSFDAFIWSFVDGRPMQNRPRSRADVPATSPVSDIMSRELKRRGFRFVGSTICYAFMQATGMVNDHTVDCFRAAEIAAMG